MARRRKDDPAIASPWDSLRWEDLEAWAGSRSVERGRAYQRQGRVHDLCVSADGRLLATVQGTQAYVTSAWLEPDRDGDEGPLQSRCSCPVGFNGCKHAVAIVADYLRQLGDRSDVRLARVDDPRWSELPQNPDDIDTADNGSLYSRSVQHPADRKWDEKIQRHLAAKSREELIELIGSLTQRFPELKEEFKERMLIDEGNLDRLVVEARRELRKVTDQAGWRNHWDGDGFTPDYSRLKHRLERLVDRDQHDAVAKLGREIITRGMDQIGQSDDDGETAMAFSECLPIVFTAVERSTLSGPEKLLLAIEAAVQDDYDVVGDSAESILEGDHAPADWSAVADELAQRLPSINTKSGDDFHHKYTRDRITNWLVAALEKAGRRDEIPALCEREARITDSYERWVRLLIDRGQYDDAARCALEGIEKTGDKLPGIARALVAAMGEVAERRHQWDIVAAHVAHELFDRPSADAFRKLIAALDKGRLRGCREQVRQAAVQFLETGVPPVRVTILPTKGRRLTRDPNWPLPVPDYLAAAMRSDRTHGRRHYDVLLDMAIADRRVDDVRHWYARITADRRRASSGWQSNVVDPYGDRVAEVIASSYPQEALKMYRQRLDANLEQVSQSAYASCGAYLRKMRPIMASLGQDDVWRQLVADIRLKYRNRPRFMEVLDRLDDRTIVQQARGR